MDEFLIIYFAELLRYKITLKFYKIDVTQVIIL